MRVIDRVDLVADWRMCMGCGACEWACPHDAIKVHDIADRGIRPIIDESLCHTCQKCIEVCPGHSLTHQAFPANAIKTLADDWGPVLDLFEGYAAEEQVRFAGSSGGAATAFALFALEEMGYDGVLHIKPDPQEPTKNTPVLSQTRDDVMGALGSRYAPAAVCQAFDQIKQCRHKCLFIGKPCDVAALRKAQDMDPELKEKVGMVISIFCAGTPSTEGTRKMLEAMGIDKSSDVSAFRYRGHGWPGSAVATLGASNQQRALTYEQMWGDILSKHTQLRCRLCPDSTGEFADISCGDPWYRDVEAGEKGRSLVLIRTEEGRRFYEKSTASGYLTMQDAEPWMLSRSQQSVGMKRKQLWGRLRTMKLFGRCPVPEYTGFSLQRVWRTLPWLKRLRTRLGTIKRIIVKHWWKPDQGYK